MYIFSPFRHEKVHFHLLEGGFWKCLRLQQYVRPATALLLAIRSNIFLSGYEDEAAVSMSRSVIGKTPEVTIMEIKARFSVHNLCLICNSSPLYSFNMEYEPLRLYLPSSTFVLNCTKDRYVTWAGYSLYEGHSKDTVVEDFFRLHCKLE